MGLDKELKDALKDINVGNSPVLKIIEEINDRAEAKDKLQGVNLDLTKQREEWETKEKEYKKNLSEFETKQGVIDKTLKEKDEKISLLEKEKLTPEEKAMLNKSEDMQATLNALLEKHSTLEKKFESETELRLKSEEEAKNATLASKKQSLENALIKELGENKIIGAKGKQALYTIFSDEMAKLHTNDDGTTEEKYYLKNSDGKLMASSLPEMVKKFAESNLHFVSPSGNSGTGQGHSSNNGVTGVAPITNLRQAKEQARAIMEKEY